MPDDVMHPGGAGDIPGAIAAPVIDHQEFDRIYARQSPGQRHEGLRKCLSFVETRYLDDQFQSKSLEFDTTCSANGNFLTSMPYQLANPLIRHTFMLKRDPKVRMAWLASVQ
jgi:hypothetical protein